MSSEVIERPEYVPKDWMLMRASDGCMYWVNPKYVGNPDCFYPCQIAEDETKDEALAYANNELDRINRELKDLEYDMVFLQEAPATIDIVKIANKWQVKAAELQEGGK